MHNDAFLIIVKSPLCFITLFHKTVVNKNHCHICFAFLHYTKQRLHNALKICTAKLLFRHCVCGLYMMCVCGDQLGVKALTVEDLLQAQKEISAHNRQLKEQTKQLERDMALLRDHSLLLVSAQGLLCCCNLHPYYYIIPRGSHLSPFLLLCICVMVDEVPVQL